MFDKAFRKLTGRKTESQNPQTQSEHIGVRYTSDIIDTLIRQDGSREVIYQGHNVMMDSFLPLLTDLLANGNGKQLKYWAIGSGEDEWDMEARNETVLLTISHECTTAATATVTLAGTPYTVALDPSSSDTISNTVTILFNALRQSGAVSSWDITRPDVDKIKFVRIEVGNVSQSTYSDGGSGAIGSITITDGQIAGVRPTPQPSQKKLINEVYRKQIQSSVAYPDDGFHFLDGNNNPVQYPTNVLEIQLTFTASEGLKTADGHYVDTKWREFAIVGGSNASSSLPSAKQDGSSYNEHDNDSGQFGYYMNVKNHPCITKTVDENNQGNMIVERKIRFTFTNADN